MTYTLIMIFLATALSACSLGAATPPPATSSVISDAYLAAGSTLTALAPPASVTPYPTPTAAPSITPIDNPAVQPSVTPIPMARATFQPLYPNSQDTIVYGCYSARLIKDVTIPDGMEMAPGQAFEKTWMFMNTGTCAWPGSIILKFIKGDFMQASTDSIGKLVNPGKKSDATVTLVAPKKEGSYIGYYKLSDKDGHEFGPLIFVSIVVSNTAISSTPTATPKTPTAVPPSATGAAPSPTAVHPPKPTHAPKPTP